MTRRAWVAAATAVALAASVVLVTRSTDRPTPSEPNRQSQASTPSPSRPTVSRSADRCSTLPFAPTYLPSGWDHGLKEGDGGQVGIALEEQSPQAYGHWSSPDGEFISVYRLGDYYTLAPDATTVKVFGDGIGVTDGRFGAVEDGFSLELRADRCRYSLIGFGIRDDQMRRFARGLVLVRGSGADEHGYALWPRFSPRSDVKPCRRDPSWRRDPAEVVRRFVELRLGLTAVVSRLPGGRSTNRFAIAREGNQIGTVTAQRSGDGCWRVVHVGPHQDAPVEVHSFSFHDAELSVGVNTGGSTIPRMIIYAWFDEGREASIGFEGVRSRLYEMNLGGDPTSQGAFLILFLNENGTTTSAFGMALPSFDTAAG